VDNVPSNNTANSVFYNIINGQIATLNLNLDCYGSETSWKILDQNTIEVYKSEGYSDNSEGLISYNLCLAEECYYFQLFDEFGDGLSGCAAGNGSYVFLDALTNTLAELLPVAADFGTTYFRSICLGSSNLSELESKNTIQIYPNPVNNELTITSSNEIEKVVIADLSGKQVNKYSVNSIYSTKIDVSKLRTGIYFAFIYSTGKSTVHKFIKI
jgi:hypothetical protein